MTGTRRKGAIGPNHPSGVEWRNRERQWEREGGGGVGIFDGYSFNLVRVLAGLKPLTLIWNISLVFFIFIFILYIVTDLVMHMEVSFGAQVPSTSATACGRTTQSSHTYVLYTCLLRPTHKSLPTSTVLAGLFRLVHLNSTVVSIILTCCFQARPEWSFPIFKEFWDWENLKMFHTLGRPQIVGTIRYSKASWTKQEEPH